MTGVSNRTVDVTILPPPTADEVEAAAECLRSKGIALKDKGAEVDPATFAATDATAARIVVSLASAALPVGSAVDAEELRERVAANGASAKVAIGVSPAKPAAVANWK